MVRPRECALTQNTASSSGTAAGGCVRIVRRDTMPARRSGSGLVVQVDGVGGVCEASWDHRRTLRLECENSTKPQLPASVLRRFTAADSLSTVHSLSDSEHEGEVWWRCRGCGGHGRYG